LTTFMMYLYWCC